MAKTENCMLAHKYKGKGFIAGWFASRKLDGMRALWYPHTRGLEKQNVAGVPFKVHSTNPEHVSTGLWSRLGNVIHAPEWWIDQLPVDQNLDGELWGDYDLSRQQLMSAVKKYCAIDSEWEPVRYWCYSIPDTELTTRTQRARLSKIKSNVIVPHVGEQLPLNGQFARFRLEAMLNDELDRGGEGMIIREPDAKYEFGRSHSMLKVKGLDDMEVVVMGCTSGRETDKGSKHLGKMGSLIVSDGNVVFQISGFTDKERELEGMRHTEAMSAHEWACKNPDQKCPEWITPKHFPIGTMVTIQYRGKSDDGVPTEARYWRKRETME